MVVERKRPIEVLTESYQKYVDHMHEWKHYKVKLYDEQQSIVRYERFLAYNRNHLLIEISQMYNLENMNIISIGIEKELK